MSILARIADRALNRPLLITPEKAETILSILAGRINIDFKASDALAWDDQAASRAPDASRFVGKPYKEDGEGRFKGLPYRLEDNIAVISVVGTLVNRGAWVGASSGLVSYEGFRFQLDAAANDQDVAAVILDLQTPGGEAVGAMEAAEAVRLAAAKKPVVAIANSMAASAGYAIASGATEIVATETAVVGSIGVVMVHADFSAKLKKDGIKPTLIYAGDHKVDGNPYEPLSKDVAADLQMEVDKLYSKFVSTVEKGRGARFTADMARTLGARVKFGEEAVEVGLADRVGSFDAVLAEMKGAHGGRTTQIRSLSMSGGNAGAPAADQSAGIPKAEHDAAVEAARAEGVEAGKAEGFKAANDRISAIAGAEGIKGQPGRVAAALDLAAKSPTMSAEDVVAFTVANIAAVDPEAAGKSKPTTALSEREHPDPLEATGQEKPKSGLSRIIDAEVEKAKTAA